MERRLIPGTPFGNRLIEHREAILRAATHRQESNVRVFGSVARGEDRPDSDIDLLVEVGPDSTASDLLKQPGDHLGELGQYDFEIHAGPPNRDFGLVEGLRAAGASVTDPTEAMSTGGQLSFYAKARP